VIEPLEARKPLSVFTVTTVADNGPGSLREGLSEVDNLSGLTPGVDRIEFAVPGNGPHTITVLSPLPRITNPVSIDSQSALGHPMIELNGSQAGPNASGLEFDVSVLDVSSVTGLVINRFADEGILIDPLNRGSLQITGNFIGTDITGSMALGNGDDGILDNNSGVQLSHNVISGNAQEGVAILGPGAAGTIFDNMIGTDATGTKAVGNHIDGIGIGAGATASQVMNNVLSGNGTAGVGGSGIYIHDNGTQGNRVLGNFIGTDATGTIKVPNLYQGVAIANGSTGNTVGGTDAGDRNIISGNTLDGVFINGSGASGNAVQGNFIGTDVTGTLPLGNGANGVDVYLGASGNTIGGTSAGTRNVISGNVMDGVIIQQMGASGNVVDGNLIGTDVTGSLAVGDGRTGVDIDSSPNNTVGGTAAAARNIISGNRSEGVFISGVASTGNVVSNNYIGTNAAGTGAIPNGTDTTSGHAGLVIRASASANTVQGNVISGNADTGVSIDNGSFDNAAIDNFIGTDFTGENALGNHEGGLIIQADAHDNVVRQNVVSGNGYIGVELVGTPGVTDNLIAGNLIGTDLKGLTAIGNGNDGVDIFEPNNTLGGTTPADRNVISGNAGNGVGLFPYLGPLTNNLILGNDIGTDVTGTAPLGNGLNGIIIMGGGSATQIGNTSGGGNTIAFNNGAGVVVQDNSSLGNTIRGNSIFANTGLGISLGGGSTPIANDAMGHTGPNDFQNFPILTGSTTSGGTTTVTGTFDETAEPNTTLNIDIYGGPTGSSGYVQGATFLGSTQITTDGSGHAAFTAMVTAPPAADQLTATAIVVQTMVSGISVGDTSEFSAGLSTTAPATPTITWSNPADITYGTALGTTQLDASSSVAGVFTYSPAAGTVLKAGSGQVLSATFTPDDTTHCTSVTTTVLINVLKAKPLITWPSPVGIDQGTALGPAQLDATSSVPGIFAYAPPAGTVLPSGQAQTLTVSFTPTDSTDYTTATSSTTINVVPTPTPTPTPPPPPLVTISGVTVQKLTMGKTRTVAIDVQFSGQVNAGTADTLAAYTLTTGSQGKKHTTKTLALSRAIYSGATQTVMLIPKKSPIPLSPPPTLTISGSSLLDTLSREIDGRGDGQPGGDYEAKLTKGGAIASARSVPASRVIRWPRWWMRSWRRGRSARALILRVTFPDGSVY
jgi:titin